MKVSNINLSFNRYRKPFKPENSVKVRSISSNSIIASGDIWKDLDEYRKTQPDLDNRELTKDEKFVYMHLPNIEIKRMYIEKILSPKIESNINKEPD